ncbi:MAG: SigB/SigF/SigG family RNA polymerase sigma factor [Acidimicrobiia bacterium]|nr:SigB/SigF/SigG family RNA polymerase sigma factor [Acidimicrobiia bacterium]MBT8216970.1 SigB/SigF/SigG family RNA polymerase sigma factor [Acidimicrobiia bacterium]NNF09069.1 SigB/SigF/SigG family RNA polymerase sigma factor [Acidimicrobiia bacterium]NNL71285.1 SigB/SigF/SigG family RNA polymerase sigma factor [Acidimicrobiia bacterium]
MNNLPADSTEVVERHGDLARALARRFRGRGEPIEDLEQVAMIGLLQAWDRFDPDHGSRFESFASVTIVGELKRHLRDKAWTVRVPRGLQEASLRVGRATGELSQRLKRSPTISEVAAETGLTDEEVIEALQVGSAYTPASLDAPVGEDDGGVLHELIGDEDEMLEMAGRWSDAAEQLAALDGRSRKIIYLRFFQDQSQSDIAEQLGISQMHVSRLLRRSLDAIRSGVAS